MIFPYYHISSLLSWSIFDSHQKNNLLVVLHSCSSFWAKNSRINRWTYPSVGLWMAHCHCGWLGNPAPVGASWELWNTEKRHGIRMGFPPSINWFPKHSSHYNQITLAVTFNYLQFQSVPNWGFANIHRMFGFPQIRVPQELDGLFQGQSQT